MNLTDIKAVIGELVGTFLFIFLSFGTINSVLNYPGSFIDGSLNPVALLIISLAFGMSLTVVITIFGGISGANFNPAITVALAITGDLDKLKAAFYIPAQLIGSALGALTVKLALDSSKTLYGANALIGSTNTYGAIIVEVILTFFLVLTVYATAVDTSSSNKFGPLAPLAIGLSVFVAHLVAIPYTNCSLNPARSFGISLATNSWHAHWLVVAAPIAGGVLAAVVYKLLRGKPKNQ